MAHHERRSLRRAQLPQRLFHFLPQLGVARETVWSGPLIRHQIQRILLLLFGQAARRAAPRVLGAFLPHAVDRIICCDPVSPCAKIRARSELTEVSVGAQKSLLNHFLGVVLVSGHAVREAKELLAVSLDQYAESIAFACERALDGEGIAFSGRVL